jgi:hypothetical protein
MLHRESQSPVAYRRCCGGRVVSPVLGMYVSKMTQIIVSSSSFFSLLKKFLYGDLCLKRAMQKTQSVPNNDSGPHASTTTYTTNQPQHSRTRAIDNKAHRAVKPFTLCAKTGQPRSTQAATPPPSPSGSRHWGGVGYVPTPFLTNLDGQTLFAAAGRTCPKAIELAPASPNSSSTKTLKKTVSFDRELVQGVYADGEICVVDWSFSPLSADGWGRNACEGRPSVVAPQPLAQSSTALSPVIILFHGLTGGSDDSNLHYLAKVFNLKGWHVVIPVRRGCAEENITVTGFKSLHYPYGDKKDTELAVRYISRK